MIIKLLTGKEYDTSNSEDCRRLNNYISVLKSRNKLNELDNIKNQIQNSAVIGKKELEIYKKISGNNNPVAQTDIPKRQLLPIPETVSVVTLSEEDKSTIISVKTQSINNSAPLGESLITNIYLFPRSEYYTRFDGTTAFAMDEPGYWGTYHRSESSRFFFEAGGRQQTQFTSPCLKKTQGVHSFFSHTGGYHSPFSTSNYKNALSQECHVEAGLVNIRDRLLVYRSKMAQEVVKAFANHHHNFQHVKIGRTQYIRPIVYTENDYPCVLIALPVLNSLEVKTEATKYWSKHPKPFQRLLLCSFIAFLNVEAIKANIPIEIVLRASFAHNLPSVCETENTFRINVGIIPKCYADLIGIALLHLNLAISTITDETSLPSPFDEKFLAQVRSYNVKKLKQKINDNELYKAVRNTLDFQAAEHSEVSFEKLYDDFCKINAGKKTSKGQSKFIPVNLKNKTIWHAIRQAGDSAGKSVLSECFRQKGTEDWFINQLMNELLAGSKMPIEAALNSLLKNMSYNDTVTMDYNRIRQELHCEKRKFANPSFAELYNKDAEFAEISKLLCDAFSIELPQHALYSALEQAGTKMLSDCRGSITKTEIADYGSSSEFSEDVMDETCLRESHLSHSKLRVCSGMKAILLAQYSALSYLRSQGIETYEHNVKQMYYEVEDALKLIDVEQIVVNKIRANINSKILHFDLNHCNSTNVANNQQLDTKLNEFNPSVIILDYTSSTYAAVENALEQCLFNKNVALVMLVDSGLKNNQGGLDYNPYGEIRICGKNREITESVLGMLQKGLSENDKLSQTTHEMVRVCKKKGLAFSLYGLFKTEEKRFQTIEAKSPQNK